MATREQKLSRARQLIAASPEVGRRQIARELRQEFGKGEGLRDAVILALQREAYPERRRIIVEPYQLAQRSEGRFKQVREGRYNKLVKMNFSADEARKFSRLPLTRLSFIKDMAKARKKIVDQLNRQGQQLKWSNKQARAELKEFIEFTYQNEGWTDAEGKSDVWGMLRDFRKDAIAKGEYTPRKPRNIWRGDGTFGPARHSTLGQKTAWRNLNKEKIAKQAVEYRQRQKEKARR